MFISSEFSQMDGLSGHGKSRWACERVIVSQATHILKPYVANIWFDLVFDIKEVSQEMKYIR